jgi:2'-5' RNA ligase
MSESRRVFVGIDFSRRFSQLITMLRTTASQVESDIKWISGKNLHLTLSFLGNIDDSKITSLISDLQEVKELSKFTLSVNGTGTFPDIEKPKVFWLGIKEGYDELSDIQSIIDELSSKYKKKQREEKFIPHITIGRINPQKINRKFNVTAFLNAVYSPIVIPINIVNLYESFLTPDGPRYRILAEFPLS